MERQCIDLYELQQILREGIEGICPQSIWVSAEIASVQLKTNGHCYLELCRNIDSRLSAKARAVIWRNKYNSLIPNFIAATGTTLQAGMEIMARVQVSYSELYGLSLVIEDLEAAYTLGAAEILRRETMEKLKKEGLLEKQSQLKATELPYRLAVISAIDAAGYGDFCRHLLDNAYGFAFELELFEATMQGVTAPESIIDALAAAETDTKAFDAILILRGGGSSLDLACFDDYGLCVAIATCSIPVYTAIGHDRDSHAADAVAYLELKTPTALADVFIDAIAAEDERISAISTQLRLSFNNRIASEVEKINAIGAQLGLVFSNRIAAMKAEVDLLASRINAANPMNLLARGYTLVSDANGIVLKSAASIKQGDKLRIFFKDGSVEATVN